MGNFTVNQGGINTNKEGMPSIDIRYGPYANKQAANDELGVSGKDVIAAGLTVGIIESGGVKEYWYQPNPQNNNALELVEKQAAEITVDTEIKQGGENPVTGGAIYTALEGKASTSAIPDVSNFITNTVNDLVNYYKKTETYSQTEVNNLIAAIKQFTYQSVLTLPEASANTMNKIYLVPSSNQETRNIKDEYITIDNGDGASQRYTWEQIGSTAISLDGYVTTSALNTALARYTTTVDLNALLATKENTSNKVTSFQATPDDTHYPSEKLVKNILDGKVDKVQGKGLSTNDYDNTEKMKVAGAVQSITRGGIELQKEDGVVEIPEEIEEVVATPVAPGGSPSATLSNGTLTLGLVSGSDGHNPNLGTFVTSDSGATFTPALPSAPSVASDYIVVVDKTDPNNVTSTIWTWDTTLATSAWASTGRDANMAYFGSCELISDVNIVNDWNTGGSHNVLSAEQGKEFGDILYGKSYTLTKGVTSGTQTWSIDNIYNGANIPSLTKCSVTVFDPDNVISGFVITNSSNHIAVDKASFVSGESYDFTLSEDTTSFGLSCTRTQVVGTGNVFVIVRIDTEKGLIQVVSKNIEDSLAANKRALHRAYSSFGKNLFNKNEVFKNAGYLRPDHTVAKITFWSYSDMIPVKPSTNYATNEAHVDVNVWFFNEKLEYIGSFPQYTSDGLATFTTPSNCHYLMMNLLSSHLDTAQLEEGTVVTAYEAFNPIKGYLSSTPSPTPTPDTPVFEQVYLTCSADENDATADYSGKNAIGDALTYIENQNDASEYKVYNILVRGHYKFTDQRLLADGGDFKYVISDEPSVIWSIPFVNIIGIDNEDAVIEVSLPDGLQTTDFPYSDTLGRYLTYTDYQCAYFRDDANIKGITFIGKNVRYTVHVEHERTGAVEGVTQTYEDCVFISKQANYGIKNAVTSGLIPYSKTTYVNCKFINENNTASVAYVLYGGHTPLYAVTNGRENCKVKFIGCDFMTNGRIGLAAGYNRKDLLEFSGCRFFDTVNIRNIGQGSGTKRPIGSLPKYKIDNSPLPYIVDPGTAVGLRVYTTNGINTSVRFDENCSAFGIVGNKNESVETKLAHSAIKQYGYEYKDDSAGSHAYACGWVNIDDSTGNSLGSILGDCSQNNKTLTIIVNGVSCSVNFTTNLTSETNDNIIALINSALNSAGINAVCDTYHIEWNEFPEFSDMLYDRRNSDSDVIERGMGVIIVTKESIRRATRADARIDGIAVDTIYPQQKGRIITKGKLFCKDNSPSNSTQYFSIPSLQFNSYGQSASIDANTPGRFVVSNDAPVLRFLGSASGIVGVHYVEII